MLTETGLSSENGLGGSDEWSVLKGILQRLCQFWYSLHHSAAFNLLGLLNLPAEWQRRDLGWNCSVLVISVICILQT